MKLKIQIFLFLLLALTGNTAWATTWYIRSDGGTDTQCTGTTDAPYPGSGTAQACAFKHPYYAFGWMNNGTLLGNPHVLGGDTVLHTKASDSFKIGYDSQWPGCSGAATYSCNLRPPASGTATNPTKIYGYSYNTGCTNPTSWWGSGDTHAGTFYIGGATGDGGPPSNFLDIRCFDLTDHDQCIDGGTNPPPPSCGIDASRAGLKGRNNDHISLKDMNIHGFIIAGIQQAGASNWTYDHVTVKNNGYVGLNFDDDNGNESGVAVTGQMIMKNGSSVTFSGCGETWPGLQTVNCWGQDQSGSPGSGAGYGDGVGFGNGSIGQWTITDSSISWNTQDGFDGLHGTTGTDFLHTYYSLYEGNAGQQVKMTAPLIFENSFAIGDCNFFLNKPFSYNMSIHAGDICRAQGNVMALGVTAGEGHKILNSTIYSLGDVSIQTQGTGCTAGTSRIVFRNDLIVNGRQWNDDTSNYSFGGDDTSAFFYNSGATGDADGDCGAPATAPILDEDYNQFWGTKAGPADAAGPHDRYGDPLIVGPLSKGPGTYSNDLNLYTHFSLTSTSPSRFAVTGPNSADETVSFLSDGTVDFNHFSRGANWDGGAVEFGSTPSCVLTGNTCANNGACCSGFCTSGRCTDTAACVSQGGACDSINTCCSPNSCQSGTCQAACVANTGACSINGDCCSGSCVGSVCQSACSANASTCGANTDCCSGICDCHNQCATSFCSNQATGPIDLFMSGNVMCNSNVNAK